ncbi:HvfC/BufC N-terminal domain-containing protein [Chitinilyticum litopenaei]|uniref:HvfC/BufC N-terminal domain-containing protein n=1 Tax=Chitinilyticum litopenaei TaxID=1121276 RepID=UPI00040CBF18|nr:DNA-binding domain-containing protein [Chitinilyticum litopenaei]
MSYATAITAFAALLDNESAAPAGLLHAERMRHYRANCRINRVAALGNTFATVEALVGEDFFAAMARVYVDATPATSANLHALGADFPDFIAGFAPAGDLPYLADVARLDWACWLAFLADDAEAVPAAALAELSPAALETLTVTLHPALQLAQSAHWPLADLLAMHQGGAAADINAGGQALLVLRAEWQQIPPARFALYRALQQGESVLAALEAALAVDDRAPVGEWLGWLFASAAVCGLQTVNGELS